MLDANLYADLHLPPSSEATGQSIRLLRKDSELSNWRLEVALLSDCPRYKALSYCWGDVNDTLSIRCNDFEMQVTRNLHSALEHLGTAFPSHQRFWIDAICINQRDKAEQAQQVGIMREIYLGADEVLIWLEPSRLPKNTAQCLEACTTYAMRWRFWRAIIAAAGGATERAPNGVWDMFDDQATRCTLEVDNPFSGDIMDGLLEVLRQPYWLRVWVIQEMCLARKARILAGQHALTWDDFIVFLNLTETCLSWDVRSMGPNFRALSQVQRVHGNHNKLTTFSQLSDLIVQFRWSRASDARDKIYGLLGLASAQDRGYTWAKSNDMYDISVPECYTRVAFYLLQQSRDLGLLVHCSTPSFITRREDLPSWVPDWEYDAGSLPKTQFGLTVGNPYHRTSATKPEIYKGYRASGDSESPTPILRDGPSGQVLVLQGIIVGRVSTVCRPLKINHQHLRPYRLNSMLALQPRMTWQEFSGRTSTRIWWMEFWSHSFADHLLFPAHAYRTGATLDIFLEYARLAQSPGTWKRPDGDENDSDFLTIMFTTLTKGHRGCEFFIPIFDNSRPPEVIIEQTVKEFRMFRDSLRWNPLFRLSNFLGIIPRICPSLYYFVLGINYYIYRGAIPILLCLIALVQALFLIAGLSLDYPSPWLWNIATIYAIHGIFDEGRIKPNWLEAVLLNPLDYALARLGNESEGQGRLALVPHNTRVGDEIALLKGSRCPFVVRGVGSKQWKLIGDCYVYGMMEGERWEEDALEEMEFL